MSTVRVFAAALTLAAVACPVQAQEGGVEYLRVGVNAAAVGLGDAYVALSRDAFSTYWNPAGLAGGGSGSVAATHHLWTGDVRGYTLAGRFGVGRRGGIGIYGSGFTNDFEGSAADDALVGRMVNVTAAYGHAFGPLRAGVAVRFIDVEDLVGVPARGFAGDVGLQAEALRGAFVAGASLRNIGSLGSETGVEPELPATLQAGIAVFPFRIVVEEDGSRVLNVYATGEVSHNLSGARASDDDATRLHLGMAAELFDLFTARGGYVTGNDVRSLSVGAGLRYESLQVDHAFVPFGEGFGAGHVLTLMYRW